MDPKRIRQATEIVGFLEQGEFSQEATNEIEAVLKKLQELAPPKGKAVKGSVTMKIDFAVVGNQVEIEASVVSKTPKASRGRTFAFLRPDGALSTEHPSQQNFSFDDAKVTKIKESK